MKKIRKKISMGVLAAVVVATPMIAISCGKDSSEQGEKKTQTREEMERRRKAEEAKSAKEKAAKEKADKEEKERVAREEKERAEAAEREAKREKEKLAIERDKLQENVYNYLKAQVAIYTARNDIKNNNIDRLKKATEAAKDISSSPLHELGSLINLDELYEGSIDDFDRSFMKVNIKAVGDSNGLIKITINLVTEGATVPKSQDITLDIQHFSDAEVEENIKQNAIWEKQKAEEHRKNVLHETEMKAKGYERVGNTYEVWFNPKTKTLIDEYKGDWDLEQLVKFDNGRYNRNDPYRTIFYYEHMEHIIVNNATSISGQLTDDLDFGSGSHQTLHLNRSLKSFEARKAEEISDDLFHNFAIGVNVIIPNVKKFDEHTFSGVNTANHWTAINSLDISNAKVWIDPADLYDPDRLVRIGEVDMSGDKTIIISDYDFKNSTWETWDYFFSETPESYNFKMYDKNHKLVSLVWSADHSKIVSLKESERNALKLKIDTQKH